MQCVADAVNKTTSIPLILLKQQEELETCKVERLSVQTQQKDNTQVASGSKDHTILPVEFVSLLKDCTKRKDLLKGSKLHDEIVRKGLLAGDPYIGSTLINMYAKCGDLEKAQEVLDGLSVQSVVLWNALISGYAQHGRGDEALNCFERMQREGVSPDIITFTCILKACAILGASGKGREIHSQIVRERLLEKDTMLANALIDMYAKCGVLKKAEEVFNELPIRDIVSWNALITGFVQLGHGKKALQLYKRMQSEGFSPNAITYTCVLKACGIVRASDVGKEVHAEIEKACLLARDIVLGNALIDMYAKCGALERAREVFEELPTRNVISWTTLIAGYVEHGHGKRALECFKEMQSCPFPPNAVTFACILKACGSIGFLEQGQAIHAEFVKEPLLGEDVMVGTALVDMYAKCGEIEKAQKAFEELSKWDVVSWNALIAGYVQHERNEEALSCFESMQQKGFLPDDVTYACILRACGGAGSVQLGQKLHADIIRQGKFEKHKDVNVALVVMYANCGMLTDAQEIFDKLEVRDMVAWSVLMAGYSQIGEDEMVHSLFDKMIEDGVDPSLITFTIVLTLCSHRGLLDKGQTYYEMIIKDYGLSPTLEHHTCMVDLFCRAGDLDRAVAVIKGMEVSPNLTLWHTLLGACVTWKNAKYGRWAFENAVKLDDRDGSAYVCMSNIYTAVGKLDEASKIEALRVEKQVGKSQRVAGTLVHAG